MNALCATVTVLLSSEAHPYEYDNNGNILYVNTLRLKPDMTAQPDTVQRAREERFRWDEENRLTALSQNGYVSNYWYDANGDRVIKEHGENMAVFVNSRQDGCVTQTGRYSVYPNPYYSYGDDGRYTKHIYIGSERVLSQVGGVYGEPRLLDVAGHDVRIKVDYPQIRASQDSVMEAAYSHFDLPYNGTDHDNFGRYKFDLPGYWNGSLQTPRDSEEDGDEGTPARTQEYLYYYHTDHLGSSTIITDGNGQLVQQIEYLPYGEVFLEKQASGSTYATPYKFNGKELDEETGLYYYGARYMNPRLSIWYATDPMQAKYPNISSYAYCAGNPICRSDFDGRETYVVIETKGTGHTFIVVNDINGITTYTYGRYTGGDWYTLGTTGPGVLVRYNGDLSKQYISNELYCMNAKAYQIHDVNDRMVRDYFDQAYNASSVYADSDNKNIRENGKVVDTYSLYGNNCTTKSCDALKYAKSKIFNIDGLFFDYDEDYTIPSSLDNYLNDLSNKKNSNVSNETTRLKNLIRKNGQNQLKSAGSVGCSSGSSASSSGSSANSSSSRASSSGNGSGSFGSGSKSSSSQDNN